MSGTTERLTEMVKGIAETICEGGTDDDGNEINGFDYLEEVLDINYITQSDKTYKGARLLVAFGGPNIWVDTTSQEVEGYWGTDKILQWYPDDNIGLDDACEELFNCL